MVLGYGHVHFWPNKRVLKDAVAFTPDQVRCPACGEQEFVELPRPHPTQAMISDGRIYERPLAKVCCPSCGLIRHNPPLSEEDIRSFYDEKYDLAVETSAFDVARGEGYAELIESLSDKRELGAVLEVGCGAGHILLSLSEKWPDTHFLGLEAAARLAEAPNNASDRVKIQHGFAEDLGEPGTGYDLIYSINVIEHTHDPVRFLAALRRQLAKNGQIIIVCPSHTPVNLEIVFLDHIHSLSAAAFENFAGQAGLGVAHHVASLPGRVDFQAFILRPEAECVGKMNLPIAVDGNVSDQFANYLNGWAKLDAALLSRTNSSSRTHVFGAGEVAALVRAYATSIWQRVDCLLVDDPAGARSLGRPVKSLASTNLDDQDTVIVATHPRSQPKIASKLSRLGFRPVVFDDLVER